MKISTTTSKIIRVFPPFGVTGYFHLLELLVSNWSTSRYDVDNTDTMDSTFSDCRQKLPVSGSISTNPVFLQQIWNLARGLYSGGSAQMVENSLGIHGDEILYVGDHIYTHKAALYKCNIAGNPAVVTRLVDNMTDNLRAPRAEATDVGNAVLDG
ncbi:hypothetical protein L2E82_30152 [Cichorium intybus]|uniref:Uncharacterized protein n=1 Tax=Cichorium intybus TaxID=13427 RepID=A0ACB9CZQ8_CICIN|nr:hypothetical protein L2E82_30152 [Cichorium intybus]